LEAEGVGEVDGGLIAAFLLFHVPPATTASAMLAYRAVQIWIPALLGGVALTRLRQTFDAEPEQQPAIEQAG
jgi:uncharacterized membrane protein YbhN (UPF0104 family)